PAGCAGPKGWAGKRFWTKGERMRYRRKITAVLMAGVLAAGLAACGGNGTQDSGSGASSENGGTHLNFSCYSYSNSMDPITNVNSSWCFLRYGVGECLFRFD